MADWINAEVVWVAGVDAVDQFVGNIDPNEVTNEIKFKVGRVGRGGYVDGGYWFILVHKAEIFNDFWGTHNMN